MTLDLVGLGEPLVVFVPDRPGPLRSVPSFERALAGAECNALLGATRLGMRCALVSAVGGDEFGAFVLETLAGGGVDVSAISVDADSPTGIYFRERSALGLPRVPIYYRSQSAASRLRLDERALGVISGGSGFLTTGITALISDNGHRNATEALEAARDGGAQTFFDPNLRPGLPGSPRARELLVPLLAQVDVYLGGERETQTLLGTSSQGSELARAVCALGPSEVVIKRGHHGSLALVNGEIRTQAAYAVAERESIGAGDAFNAGYITSRRQGEDPETALRTASVCGAAACGGTGDWETFPRRDELTEALMCWRAH